jgi:hypothetical protein
MKKLVFENLESIQAWKVFCQELVFNLNTVLSRFKANHNHFGQTITEDFAFELVSAPIETFDSLLRANSPLKPVAGKPLDMEKLSELTGVDRKGWIKNCTLILPGSKNRFNKAGIQTIMKLTERDRPLVTWRDGEFILNDKRVEAGCEKFRVYAESLDQISEVEFWETLADNLNKLLDRREFDVIDANQICGRIKMLEVRNGRFIIKAEVLARRMKTLVAVN